MCAGKTTCLFIERNKDVTPEDAVNANASSQCAHRVHKTNFTFPLTHIHTETHTHTHTHTHNQLLIIFEGEHFVLRRLLQFHTLVKAQITQERSQKTSFLGWLHLVLDLH